MLSVGAKSLQEEVDRWRAPLCMEICWPARSAAGASAASTAHLQTYVEKTWTDTAAWIQAHPLAGGEEPPAAERSVLRPGHQSPR